MRKIALAAAAAILGAVLGTPLAVIGAQAYQAVNGSAVTSQSTVRGGNGTAAAPTFSFSSDTDLGIYRNAANTLGVSATLGAVIGPATTQALTNGPGWAPLVQIVGANYPAISLYKTAGTARQWDIGNNDGALHVRDTTAGTVPISIAAGTSVTSFAAAPILVSDGTAGAPGLGFATDPTTGFYQIAGGVPALSAGGVATMLYTSSALFRFATGAAVTWSSGAITAASDAGLSRISAGVVGVGTGAAGSVAGDVHLARVKFGNAAEPACNSTNRGHVVMVQGGAGVADTFRICSKDAADAYAYRALY